MFLSYSLYKKGYNPSMIEEIINSEQSKKELFLAFAKKENEETCKMISAGFGGGV